MSPLEIFLMVLVIVQYVAAGLATLRLAAVNKLDIDGPGWFFVAVLWPLFYPYAVAGGRN